MTKTNDKYGRIGSTKQEYQTCETGIEGCYIDGRSQKAQSGCDWKGGDELDGENTIQHTASSEQSSFRTDKHGSAEGSTFHARDAADEQKYDRLWQRHDGKDSGVNCTARDKAIRAEAIASQVDMSGWQLDEVSRLAGDCDLRGLATKLRYACGGDCTEGEQSCSGALDCAAVCFIAVVLTNSVDEALERPEMNLPVVDEICNEHSIEKIELLEYGFSKLN